MNTNNIIPTKHFQVRCLLQFAADLGYSPRNSEAPGEGFVNTNKDRYAAHCISFKDMCLLYNGKVVRFSKNTFCALGIHKDLGLSTPQLMYAVGNKPTKQVKLQRCKSEKDKIKCFDDFICLTDLGKKEYGFTWRIK